MARKILFCRAISGGGCIERVLEAEDDSGRGYNAETGDIILRFIGHPPDSPVQFDTTDGGVAGPLVIIIPKKNNPENLGDCRNLSCTPLFSKVLETFVLKQLKQETSFADSQYGGMKGCGVDLFLIDILDSLEDDRACANVISVDFEKAFNRMNHEACLQALANHGASDGTIRAVRSFLQELSLIHI